MTSGHQLQTPLIFLINTIRLSTLGARYLTLGGQRVDFKNPAGCLATTIFPESVGPTQHGDDPKGRITEIASLYANRRNRPKVDFGSIKFIARQQTLNEAAMQRKKTFEWTG